MYYRCKTRIRNYTLKSGIHINHSRHQLDSTSRFVYLTHTQNEAINTYIAKCAPKTKAYGMTISLTNRVTIAIGISDFGAEKH